MVNQAVYSREVAWYEDEDKEFGNEVEFNQVGITSVSLKFDALQHVSELPEVVALCADQVEDHSNAWSADPLQDRRNN